MQRPPIDEVIAIVRESRRYGRLHERTLRRVAERALSVEGGKVQPAAKRAKKSLHQIFGAYLPERPAYARLLERLTKANQEGHAQLRSVLVEAMSQHASTRERLGVLDAFYGELFERLGPVRSILDLACGLNPLAFPWMPFARAPRYVAVDVDRDLVAFVAACLSLFGAEHDARLLDVVDEPVEEQADVALLLKLLPCLERQDPDAPLRLIRNVRASRLVVSFPTRSIGGRDKGMRDNYAVRFERLVEAERLAYDRLEFPGELVYIVTKGSFGSIASAAAAAPSSSVSRR